MATPMALGENKVSSLPRVEGKHLTRGKILDNGANATVFKGSLLYKGCSIKVAIKVPYFPDINKIENEAKVLHEVQGAGGAPILFGITREEPYSLVMTYCPGHTLGHYLLNHSTDDCLHAFVNLYTAVEELHSRGFSHNDLHSNNIILHKNSSDVKIHIIDMGHAKLLLRDSTDEGTTLDYKTLLIHANEIVQLLDNSSKYEALKRQVQGASHTFEGVRGIVEIMKTVLAAACPKER
ncbi:serine/threonine-protein kinase ULK2-like [Procambarus clarkii]|uniref:serine/threonine-protein kinase ULK2-like n=1 Tax=Procambarus clarkii TaxID=6728 RepID=UPI0037432FDF